MEAVTAVSPGITIIMIPGTGSTGDAMVPVQVWILHLSHGDSEAVLGHYLKDHREQWLVCTKTKTVRLAPGIGHWGRYGMNARRRKTTVPVLS